MRRTKEEAALTRESLLDAAISVFSQKGYSATTLDDIAQAAKVTRGAVYHHFGGKAEIYSALVNERFGRVAAVFQQAFNESGTPLQILRRSLVRSLEFLEEDASYRAVVELTQFKTELIPELLNSAGMQKKLQANSIFIEALASLVRQGIVQGEIKKEVNPQIAALAAAGLFGGLTSLWLQNPQAFSLRNQAGELVDTFLNGLKQG